MSAIKKSLFPTISVKIATISMQMRLEPHFSLYTARLTLQGLSFGCRLIRWFAYQVQTNASKKKNNLQFFSWTLVHNWIPSYYSGWRELYTLLYYTALQIIYISMKMRFYYSNIYYSFCRYFVGFPNSKISPWLSSMHISLFAKFNLNEQWFRRIRLTVRQIHKKIHRGEKY